MDKLISIITPFFQAERYLATAIETVLNQTHQNWELLLINDGSTDASKSTALIYDDPRIRYFEQENTGVSAARNLGLKNMLGDYFCFLDADDALPPNSLRARLQLFEEYPSLDFVDGVVFKMDSRLQDRKDCRTPAFQGNPLIDMIHLSGESFFGPSWMIKRKPCKSYQFHEGLTHGEDLFFYMQLAKEGGQYDFTTEPILYYRDSPGSAMKNLQGLEMGYRFIESQIKDWPEVSKRDLNTYRFRYKKAMSLAYFRANNFKNAFTCWI